MVAVLRLFDRHGAGIPAVAVLHPYGRAKDRSLLCFLRPLLTRDLCPLDHRKKVLLLHPVVYRRQRVPALYDRNGVRDLRRMAAQ